MKKKILYVITKSNWGGAQRYVYDLAASLIHTEFDVAVVLGGNGPLKKKLEEKGMHVIAVPAFQRDISLPKEISAFFQMIQIFRTEKPDVVHLNSSKAGGLGALAARFAGIPKIVFTAHGWPFLESRDFISRGLMYFFSWLTALLSDKIITVSDHDLKIAQKMPFLGQKAVRIYNGIDLSSPLGSGNVIRGVFPSGVHITGTIGELNKNKNQIALIEAARNNPGMYVAIVGEGGNQKYLEEKIKGYGLQDRVKLFGFMPSREALRGFDTFTLPSLKEGLPYVLLEAKAAGVPTVANRVGGVGEILDAKDMTQFSIEKMLLETKALYRN